MPTTPPREAQQPRRWWIYLICALIALAGVVALDAFADIEALWAVAGIVAGFGLGGLWLPLSSADTKGSRAGVAPQSFSKLGRAAVPLILPLLVFLVAGTVKWDAWVQFAAGAGVALFTWGVIMRPELDKPWRKRVLAGALGVMAVVSAGIIAYDLIHGQVEAPLGSYADRGGASHAFLIATVFLWAGAIVIRLVSFSTSVIRAAAAAALVVAAAGLVFWIGVFGISDSLGDHALDIAGVAAIVAFGLLALEALLGIAATLLNLPRLEQVIETPALPEGWAQAIGGVGLGAATVAAVTLGFAALIGLAETEPDPRGPAGFSVEPGRPGLTPEAQLAQAGKHFPADLVRTYMPELAFRDDQPWLPEAVDEYVDGAWLQGTHGGADRIHSLADLPGPDDCPGLTPAPCFHLSIRCESAAEECSGAHPVGPGDLREPQRSGAVYVHVIRKSQHRDLFPKDVGVLEEGKPWVLIQYWYFYRYDEARSSVLPGDLVQRHEGDWEAVTVGLSREEPLFVGYSQHCHGEWRPWESIEAAPIGENHTHPLVAVAKGSQANYVRADQGIAPDFAECAAKLPPGTLTLLSYASNIRDRTDYDFGWMPPPGGVINSGVARPPMSFPGYWGAHETATLNLENKRPHEPTLGGEPRTPSMQELWTDPLRTVFCKWHRPPHTTREATCPPPPT